MKVIPKMQSGGGMPPFTYYTPVTVADTSGVAESQETEKASSTDSTKGQITDKDLLEMVGKIDGLPNDMNDLVTSLSRFYQMDNLFSRGRVDTSQLSGRYLSALRKLKIANFNKKEYDKAYEKVNQQGGLSEIAITDNGRVVVQDKDGGIQQISSQEYLNNRDQYRALTNSNLLYLRAHSPEFSFSNEILSVVENGIGIPTITKIIEDAIGNLGTNTISKQGYSYKKEGQILKGIEILQEAANKGVSLEGMSLDGMYKNQLLTKDQYSQAKQAIQYIYDTLPSNAHTLLEVKSGNTENPRAGALDLIANLVISKTNNTVEFDTDIQTDLNPDGTKKSTSSQDDTKSNPLLNIVQGIGGEKSRLNINAGNNVEMSVDGLAYSPQDQDGKHIKETSLENMLFNSGMIGVASQNGYITFGDQVLDPSHYKDVVYRGTGVTRVVLPSRLVDGKTVPDFSIMEDWLNAQKEINQIPNDISIEERQKREGEILYNHGLLELLDPTTGRPNYDRFSLFAVADAYGTSKDDVIKDSQFVEEVVDADDSLYQEINRALFDKENPSELDQFNIFNPFDWFGNYDRIYKAAVYIPLSNNKLQAITAYGDQVKYGTAQQQEANYQRWLKRQQAGSTSAGNL